MKIINTHQAKTQLSKLLHEVAQGREVVIGRSGTPVAKLVPVSPAHSKRKGGQLQGEIEIAPDFDDLPEGFMRHFTADADSE